MTFAERLLQLRAEKKIMQKDIAEAIGVATRVYQRYEYGEREPQLHVLVALADFYDVSLDYLTGRSNQR